MSADVAETPLPLDDQDELVGIPDELRFDVGDRTDRTEGRIEFALGSNRVFAHKPKDYTMLALASAMSGMADSGDIAYCVMLFCHDAFDGPTRNLVSQLDDTELLTLIERLCDKWGQDTSTWKKGNREQRRAVAKPKSRRR